LKTLPVLVDERDHQAGWTTLQVEAFLGLLKQIQQSGKMDMVV
jgi:hypothetical protein